MGLAACGGASSSDTSSTTTEQAITTSFRHFMHAVYARDLATACRLSFPRGDRLLTAADLHRIAGIPMAQQKWIAACKQSKLFLASTQPHPPGDIAIRDLAIHGDIATAHVTGEIATVQTPGKPTQPTQFIKLHGQWLTTVPVPIPS
jgi:hypothetical protein